MGFSGSLEMGSRIGLDFRGRGQLYGRHWGWEVKSVKNTYQALSSRPPPSGELHMQ